MIGWTWKHFIEHPNQPEWLARLPMTKAAVRGMDTVTAFVQRKFGCKFPAPDPVRPVVDVHGSLGPEIHGGRCFKARLDYMDHRSGRQARGCCRPHRYGCMDPVLVKKRELTVS